MEFIFLKRDTLTLKIKSVKTRFMAILINLIIFYCTFYQQYPQQSICMKRGKITKLLEKN